MKIHYFSENRLWLPQMVRASISHVESFAWHANQPLQLNELSEANFKV